MLPKEIAKRVPKTHLMSETEWRNLGVQQSQGWVHYMIHQPGMCSGVYGQFSKDFFHLIALLHSWVWNRHASVTKSTSRRWTVWMIACTREHEVLFLLWLLKPKTIQQNTNQSCQWESWYLNFNFMLCIKIFINVLLCVKPKYGLFGINAKVTKSFFLNL